MGIDQHKTPDTGRCEVERNWCAKRPTAKHDDALRGELLLAIIVVAAVDPCRIDTLDCRGFDGRIGEVPLTLEC